METRFGSLKFDGGVPDQVSTEKIFDNLDYQRAVQAYLLGLPPVNQLANRTAMLSVGPVNRTVPIWEQMVDSRTIELTANDNTPYTWFWLDLRNGPLVLEVPPMVLGLINDMWYRWAGDVGITGPDKGKGGKYLLLPPGYKGDVPKGYFVVRPATYNVWVPWRTFLVKETRSRASTPSRSTPRSIRWGRRRKRQSWSSSTCRASPSTWWAPMTSASGRC